MWYSHFLSPYAPFIPTSEPCRWKTPDPRVGELGDVVELFLWIEDHAHERASLTAPVSCMSRSGSTVRGLTELLGQPLFPTGPPPQNAWACLNAGD